jgi:hypothetical protein
VPHPRYLRRYPTQRNLVRNTELIGAAAGNPGTRPRDWSWQTVANGLSQSVALSWEQGLHRFDWRIFGTPTADTTMILYFTPSGPSPIRAQQGRDHTVSVFCKLVAGALPASPGYLTLGLAESDASNAFLSNTFTQIFPNAAQPLRRQRQRHTATAVQAACHHIDPTITIFCGSGVAVDFTIGVAGPQVERGSAMGAFERRTSF